MLSKEAITEFQKIYQEEFGIDISYSEASDHSIKFLKLFNMIYQPVPEDWLDINIANEKK